MNDNYKSYEIHFAMKKIFSILGFYYLFLASFGQTEKIDVKLNGLEHKTGTKVSLNGIYRSNTAENYEWQAFIASESGIKYVELKELNKYVFTFNNINEFWQLQALINKGFETVGRHGLQYNLRQEWENEALQYLNELEQKELLYKDDYLKYYLNQILSKLFPGTLKDGRPGYLTINIMIDSYPSSYIFTNGSMIITTGLISTLNTEEELISILAHEIAHFVLDHGAYNINKMITRQKSAEFWANFATTVAAATEFYTSYKNPYYIPGALTFTTAVLSNKIASAFIERLGLQYSLEQESAADRCAINLLKYFKADTTALSSALSKIKDYYVNNGINYEISGEGSYSNISQRINTNQVSIQTNSETYEKLIVSVNRTNAIIEFHNNHFFASEKLADRNILSGIPTEDDYILKVMTNQCLYNNSEKNLENLDLINRAKKLNVYPTINLFKQEALVLIRLGRYPEAILALESYRDKLTQEHIRAEKTQLNFEMQYLEDEMKWAAIMINTSRGL